VSKATLAGGQHISPKQNLNFIIKKVLTKAVLCDILWWIVVESGEKGPVW
jgi:hypothetical protein